MAELDLIMQPYIDSGNYTEEELEKIRKLEYNKLQQNTRETSWWKGEEGWIPDELQPGVNRPRVKKEKPSVVDEFLETTNDQTEIQKRKDHSAATASLQPGDKEIPYRVEEDGNYRQDGTLIKENDVYDPERKDASSVLDEIGESASGMALPFGISWVALAKVKNPRIRAIGALGLAFGFDQIVPDSDEEEDIVEETDDYGNVPIVDFFDDVYNNIQQGYGRSKGVEPGLQVQNFTGGDVNELRKNIKELYENDLVLAAKGQTDEQRSYQKVYDNNKKKHGKIMAWMMAIKENPSFLAQTSANSIANFAGTFANSGTARERMGIAGATTYASGQGVNKLLKKNKIGQLTSFLSGAYGANSMTMEQSYTFVDLMKEQLAADGKEFNPENIENLILDKEITTFKDPRFSTLDITGTKFEIMKKRALRRGVSIGFVDAVSGGITGQFIGPGNKIKALSLPGFAVPVAGGLTSEIAGQTAGGQEYDAGEILTEGFAEKGGPMVLLNTTRDIVDKIKNPPLYKINGEQFTKSQFLDYTNKMSDQDISKIKIEVENDQDVALDIRERRHRATIDNEIDSSITDPKDRKRLIDLEIQRAILENNQKTKKGSRKVVGNEKKLERTEEKINSILSKYEGVKREDVRSQADVGIAQSKADVKFENNMAFAKKHSSLYGLKYQELSQQEIKEKYGERYTVGAGFVDSNNNLVINKEQAQKQMFGDYVGNHELLHGIIKASGAKIKQGTINNFLKLIGKDNAALLQKKINENKDVYTDEYLAKNRDEYFTIFSDLLADAKKAKQQGREYVQLDTNMMTQIKDWVRRVLADLGFANVDFETAEGALNFLKDYNKSIHKGALSRGVVKATKGKADMTGGTVMSRSQHLTKEQATKKINELGKRFESKDGSVIDFEKEHGNIMFKGYAPEIWDQIQEEGILDGLILAQPHEGIDSRDFLDTTYAELFSWFEKYEPERKNESGLFGHVNPQIPNRAKQAYNVITKGEIKYAEEIGETTKEGEIKIQVEAEPDTYMEALETEDLSPQAVAKREAQKNKKKEQRYSKLRQDLGIETDSDLYNKVKDSARQSLILAYQKTRDIENKNDRAAAIAKIIADEYAGEKGITSGKYTELFKLIKNSLGNKAEYVKNLKKNRESIVESIFTSDFVQIERKVPENEKVFIVFKEKLTSKKQVEDAVNKILLPKDSLKAIDKGQAVNLYGKVMPTPDQFVGFFNQPLTIEKTDKEGNVYHIRSGLKGTRKDGLAKHLSKALIFDALMEVRQEPKVAKLLTEEFNAELDIVDLAAKISREVDVKFSASQRKEIEHQLTSREENILLPSYLNKEINRLKQHVNPDEYELLEILETMQDLSGSGAVNIYSIMLNAFPYAFKNLVVADFSSEQSFVDAIKKNTQAQMKINAYTTSKRILEKQTRGLIKNPELAVPIIVDYLINVGRDVRSALIVKRNKALKIDVIDELHDGKFKDYFKAEETFEGSGKYKMQYKNSKGEFVDVEIYDSVKKIKENINNPGFRNEFNKQAERAQESRLNTLDPENTDLTLADKLDNIELSNTGTRGVGRKTAKVDVTVTVDMDPSELVLEHEVTIKNMKSYERAYARGDISREQMKSVYEQNKVHILPKSAKSIGAKKLKKLGITEGIDDILKRVEKVSQRQGMGYESIPSVEEYLRDLRDKGIIDKLPDSLDQSFERQSENFKDAVLFSKSSKKPTKGITILDFDDTLATSSSLIRFTRPDGTKGTLTPEQYASTYQDLLGLDYEFDFSEFNKVVDGKPAPLLNKAKKLAGKFGTDNMFILTARPQQSAPAIQKFLKENGLDIPLKNITGLGNSTADAKALWVLDKAAEGYNDFYFADDAIQNVKAVQNMLDQIDVKSKVQQARVKFSASQDKYFNAILEDVSGVPSFKKFSQKVGEAIGFGKGKFRWFIPPSHEDFMGLLYNFIGKGKKGNNHRDFFEKTLIKPLNRAYRRLNEHKQVVSNNYKKLVNHMPDIQSRLGETIPNTDFTYEQAVRIYLWNKAGYKIPGLSKNQETTLVNIVKSYSDLQKFADMLGRISLVKEGYTTPGENWLTSSIKFDLVDATGRVGRAKIFSEFIENAGVIFSPENLNKIESIYGKNFRKALEDVLDRTITGSNRPSGGNEMVNAWMDWVNGSVGAVMFFNVRSMMLQQLSFVNFMNFADNNIFKTAARFADQPQFWDDWAMIFNSNYLKQRRAGASFDVNANEIAREVSRSKNPVRAVIRKLLDIGFTPTQIGDSFAIAMGGSGFYRNRVNTYIKQGLSKKESESKAFLDFQEIAEETQQSARPDMISQQQASPLGRFVLAFQNVTSQYARIVKKSYLDLIKRRISKGYTTQAQSDQANISRIIYYGAIQSMIFYGLQTALFGMMFGDDDDEKFLTKKERVINGTIDSLLRGTGVYGAVAATIKNYAFKLHANLGPDSEEYFKSEAWPDLLQISPPIGIKIRQWRSMERTLDWNKDAIKEMETFDIDNPLWDATSKGVEAFTNTPVNRLYKKIQNIRAGLDSENAWWQRIAVTLGWSKWDVGIEESDKIKKAKVIGKRNRKKNRDKSGEEANREKKDGGCIAASRSGDRCKNKAESGGYCTIHAEVEQNKTGEKQQCKGQRSSGGRCKMETSSKSGYCYYHD